MYFIIYLKDTYTETEGERENEQMSSQNLNCHSVYLI